MMEGKVIWRKKGLQFGGTADSGFELPLGSESEGFRPMELFVIGLAGCTAMDVLSILQKKKQDVSDFEVQVHVDQADEHPKVFTKGQIEYLVTGRQIEETALVRSIELSATRYCPAQAMLAKVFPIELTYSIYEDEGNGNRKLTQTGSYTPVPEIQEIN
jgi:putative redox protein